MATILGCPSCGAKNRVAPVPRGTPRCARCKTALPWIVVADESSFAAESEASVPVLVDFWAPWCGPCRLVEPALAELASERAGSLKVVKVNVDENAGLAARFEAMSIPLLVILRDSKEVDRVVGAVPKTQLAALSRRSTGRPADAAVAASSLPADDPACCQVLGRIAVASS